MRNLLIVGAGQLGSRHLQGALKVEKQSRVFVIDPSEKSLEIAEARANEIPNTHEISFTTKWSSLPNNYDIVIVATSANVRAKVVTELLENYNVDHLILEKVLFQDIKSYDIVSELIKKTNTNTLVNHPRRTFDFYKNIKNEFKASNDKKLLMQVVGGNWGLACNALHFIDMFCFITDSKLSKVTTELVEDKIIKSKREGFSEFSGTLNGYMESGDSFSITSFFEGSSDITVSLSSNSKRWLINEGREKKMIKLFSKNGFKEENHNIVMDFQSNLTTNIVSNLYSNKETGLTSYKDASNTHTIFIKALLKKYKEITNQEIKNCPIT
jgi:predicted dehydrogenase